MIMICIITQISWAADISSFVLQVSPNPMRPGEAADMTVKAVKSDGSVATDYKWTIIMDLGEQDTNAYDLPSNWFYQFTTEDQWVKTFSKWFTIKKTGQYTLKIFDSISDAIIGSLPIVVGSTTDTSTSGTKLIEISEPTTWSTVEWSSLNVVWKTDSRKTPLQFFIDDKKVITEWETDDSGNFSVYLTDIGSGSHTLQVKMVDYAGTVLGTSDSIPFTYTIPETDAFMKSFTASPDGEINVGDAVVFDAKVDGTVRSVEMKIGNLGTFIMDRAAAGTFNKTVIIDKSGTYIVDVTLIFDGWQRKIYLDRATLHTKWDASWIWLLKVVSNAADPSKVSVSWNSITTSGWYLVRYWQSQDSLTSEVKTTANNVEVSGLEVGKQYYFQVFSLDANGTIVGKWSDIASLITQWQSAAWEGSQWPSCTIVGIKIRTEKIGDQYFLVRDAVPWATEYHIYKSDYEVNSIQDMQKIGTTTVPQFAYPFNEKAKKDEYTFYSVVATCSDGQNLQIDNVKKVHTWPLSDMLILFFVSLMSYSLYRIYRYS